MRHRRPTIILVFLIFIITVLIVLNFFIISIISGTVLSVNSSQSGKGLLVQVDYSNYVNTQMVYLYYDNTKNIDPGDKIIAFCRPVVQLSDPPYVGAIWIFIGKNQ